LPYSQSGDVSSRDCCVSSGETMKGPDFKFLFRSYLRRYYVYLYRVFTRHLRLSFRFGWGTALHVGRLRVRFPMMSLEFFIDVAVLSTQPLVPRVFPGAEACWCLVLTTLPPSYADCLGTLWASTSWSPQGLSRPVQGLLYLYHSLGHSVQWTMGPMCTVAVSHKLTWFEYASDQSRLHLIHGLALNGGVASKHSGQYTDIGACFGNVFILSRPSCTWLYRSESLLLMITQEHLSFLCKLAIGLCPEPDESSPNSLPCLFIV
jgi:hypothetical protein